MECGGPGRTQLRSDGFGSGSVCLSRVGVGPALCLCRFGRVGGGGGGAAYRLSGANWLMSRV